MQTSRFPTMVATMMEPMMTLATIAVSLLIPNSTGAIGDGDVADVDVDDDSLMFSSLFASVTPDTKCRKYEKKRKKNHYLPFLLY